MRLALCLALVATVAARQPVAAQTTADSAAIRAAALDYIEGWFTGDADRMTRALHPEMVKRIVVKDPVSGRNLVDGMGATRLIEGTRRKFGTEIPAEQRRTDVTVLDIFGAAASVKVDAGPWIDYLHVVKFNGEWRILNVLWERR